MTDYYVYVFIDLAINETFYIGKGRGDRYLDHLALCHKQNTAFYKRLHPMVMTRKEDIHVIFLKSGMTEIEAFEFEIEMIAKYGRLDLGTGCLTNRTDGGDSPAGNSSWLTEAQRVELSNRVRKRFEDPKERERSRKRGIVSHGRPIEAFNLTTGETVLQFECI